MKAKDFRINKDVVKDKNSSKKNRLIKALLIGFGCSLLMTFLIVVIPNVFLNFTLIPFDFRFIASVFIGLFAIYSGVIYIVLSTEWKTYAKVLTAILVAIIGTGLVVGAIYLITTFLFFGGTAVSDYNRLTYSVVVEDTSSAKEIVDLTGKKVGFLKSDESSSAMNTLWEYLDYEDETVDSIDNLANDLINNKIQAICLENGTLNMLYDEKPNFKDSTKVIFTFKVQEKSYRSTDKMASYEPFVIYVSGIDQYGDVNMVRGRSDVNQLIVVNPRTHEILLVNTPRDYYVQLADTTGLKDKLTHAGIYGVEKSIKTMEELYDVDINYYIRVNFDSLVNVVNTIGGIDVVSDRAFKASTDSSVKVQEGLNHFDGKQALAYARERYSYESGDRHRGENQQQIMSAIIEKMTSSPVLLSNYNAILTSLNGAYQTDIPYSMIVNLLLRQLDGMPSWEIESISVDGTGSMQPTYSMGANLPLYVMIPNEVTLQTARTKIAEVIDSE